MLSYPVCRVGVGTDACCCLLLLAVNSVLWPPNLGDGLQPLAMASILTLPCLVSYGFLLRPACGTAVKSVRISVSVCDVECRFEGCILNTHWGKSWEVGDEDVKVRNLLSLRP